MHSGHKHSDHKGEQGKTLVTTVTWQTCILIQTILFKNTNKDNQDKGTNAIL